MERRAIRCIFCSAKAPQKDAAAIPHPKIRKLPRREFFKYMNTSLFYMNGPFCNKIKTAVQCS